MPARQSFLWLPHYQIYQNSSKKTAFLKLSPTQLSSMELVSSFLNPKRIKSDKSLSGTAENVQIRKEWRNLTDTEKTAFIDAELCLMSAAGQTGLPGAVGRYDDLQAVHQHFTNTTLGNITGVDIVHGVVSFTITHRSRRLEMLISLFLRGNSYHGTGWQPCYS